MGPRTGPASIKLAILVALCLLLLSGPSNAVKRGDFKTCDEATFCKRNRERATRASSPEFSSKWQSPYKIRSQPVWFDKDNTLQAILVNELYPKINFVLDVGFVKGSEGTMRIKLDELNGLRQRFNEAEKWTLWKHPQLIGSDDLNVKVDESHTHIEWKGALGHKYRFELKYDPVLITLLKDDQPHIELNERGLLNMEHFRVKPTESSKTEESLDLQAAENEAANPADGSYPGFRDTTQEGMWEDTFGGRTDSKPKGPESLSLDITFPGYSNVYGIPEHASPLSLKTTRGSANPDSKDAYTDPYRLWNLDVFEYEHDSEMALYGAIPLMKAHRSGSTVGVFWLNSAETWVDIEKKATKPEIKNSWKQNSAKASSPEASDFDKGPTDTTTTTHWISESGIMDLFIFLGPTSKEIFSAFGSLVGTTTIPPFFSIAYHQCRWNYVSQEDLLGVIHNFDKFDIPIDVIWLDIEYAEEHKYFIWNKKAFPEPLKMIGELESTGRKLVTIVDPHIKRTKDLYVYKEAVDLGVLCKLPDGSEYEGWCWTGSSSWVDYFDPKSWDWWSGLFKFNKYRGSTVNVHNWLDMNEPSVFNAPEITMPRDNIHFGGWEHRDLHNLNAMASHNQSSRGLRERTNPPMRGLVLSRGFFAGSQRYGPIWQGDNMGTWEHLAVSIPMLLSNGIAGMAFNGADVGGFFGNPSHELLVRWYQTGAFYPFFRAHAHIDTKRREPYLFDEPIRGYLVDMIKLRYTLLPSWYTAFFENTITGAPIAIPQYVMFPNDEPGFTIDDQFYIGSSGLLVKPITKEGSTVADVYLADQQPYYNYFTYDVFRTDGSKGSFKRFSFHAPLNTVPLFIRGGHIFTRRDLVRRAAPLALKDPLTLVVALDNDGSASGTLYLDDGESFNHDRGEFVYRAFSFKKGGPRSFSLSSSESVSQALKSTTTALNSALKAYRSDNNWTKKISAVTVQKIIVLGLPSKPNCVRVAGKSKGLSFDYKSGLSHDVKSVQKTGAGKSASRLEIKNADVHVVSDWSIEFNLAESCPVDETQTDPNPMVTLQSKDCPVGYFQCKNAGHNPSCIRISRVNDGICDPECCDGSDEAENRDVDCPNRCQAAGAAYRQRREKQLSKFRSGNRERQAYIVHGQKEQVRLRELVKSLQIDMITLKAKERDAKSELERAERSSEAEINKLKETELYKKVVKFQGAIESLNEKGEKLQKELDQLNKILKDLKAGYNPNYQDMAVKGAVKGFEEWESTKDLKDYSSEGNKGESQTQKVSSDEVEEMLKEDPVSLMTGALEKLGYSQNNYEKFHSLKLDSYLPESLKSSYEAIRDFLADALEKVGVSNGKVDTGDSSRAQVVKAKSLHQDSERAVSDAQSKIDESNSSLEKDWGKDWEFKKLDQTCLEIDHAEYTYEVCLFGEAFQKSSDGGRTSLGRFSRWNEDAHKGTPEYYSKQFYLNGAKCWNGPERSARVDIKCGEKNRLYSVMEPEKCEYWFKMTSPAACHDGLDKLSEETEDDQWVVIHDEL